MVTALGTFLQKLDEKGRIVLPSKARAELSEGGYLTRGQTHCVYLFSERQFQAYRDQMREQVPEGMPAAAFNRLLFASVVSITPDKTNRVSIPEPLRQYARLERDLAVLGLEDRMEIWDAQSWQDYQAKYERQFSDLFGDERDG
ncbi:MAG: division/cell wall cluster transcriptional repressor MraZ [Bifidobacteriaceae bacterium]|jgi:MraZ protein|nr:division/cell wall cluster transcriptional repressor MraZ [Bifidobacteriaceae bacterium]